MIIRRFGGDTAALRARRYRGGGLSDWYLPARDELRRMFDQRSVVGGLGRGGYWSSSQDRLSNGSLRPVVKSVGGGLGVHRDPGATLRVRPIRAF